jgi:DNA-binding response OmpR family regulator
MRLLVIEDELPMRTALAETLQAHGYRVSTAADGNHGLQLALEKPPDLVLLDVMMKGLDGYELCRQLRRRGSSVPVLMLTAKALVDDRVEGLDAGADDYLTKPFSMRELLARIKALLRRADRSAAPDSLRLGDFSFDFIRHTCQRAGEPVPVSARELAMMRLLAQANGKPVSREAFLDIVWGYNSYPSARTVDNHIAILRAKIEEDPSDPKFILTVRGVGYRLATRTPLESARQAGVAG